MISIDDLADEIMDALEEYAEVSIMEFEKIAKDIAKQAVKKLKASSPKGTGTKKGHYASGWSVSVIKKSAHTFEFVVHNKKKPGLTHLLENGHQLRQGGRAKAFPHILAVEQWCKEEFVRRTEDMLRG